VQRAATDGAHPGGNQQLKLKRLFDAVQALSKVKVPALPFVLADACGINRRWFQSI
jgi:hypothetical protein